MFEALNFLTLSKDGETYRFIFDDANRQNTLRQIAQFAANPELNLNWYDAAVLSRKVRDGLPQFEQPATQQPTQQPKG